MNENRLELAEIGHDYWNHLKEKGSFGDDFLVLWLCDEDQQLGCIALSHLPDLLKEKNAKDVILLCFEKDFDDWQKQVMILTNQPYYITLYSISHEESEGLLAFYEMYQFTERFYIISLTKPFGSKLPSLQKKLNLSKTTLLKHCIYQMTD